MKTALLVVDVQNEYFGSAGGNFPQANADETGAKIAEYVKQAEQQEQLIVNIQHFTPEGSPLFARQSKNAELHASVADVLADKPLVEKAHADSFLNTNLQEILAQHEIEAIDVCGIMTQNCVTHTALSPAAAAYKVRVLGGLCTAPSELIHAISLDALKDRVEVV